MAAVICNALDNILRGCGNLICLPCRVCGFVTDEIVDAFNHNFCFFVTVVLGLSVPPIVFGIQGFLRSQGDGICDDVGLWLLINFIACFINIMAAIYIAIRIQFHDYRKGDDTRSSSCSRAKEVLCHDIGVALWIFFLIFFFAWQIMGMLKDCDDEYIMDRLNISVLFGWLFFLFGAIALGCSLCCMRGSRDRR